MYHNMNLSVKIWNVSGKCTTLNNLQTVCKSCRLVVDPELEPVVEDSLVHGGELVPHGGAPQVLWRQDEQVAQGVGRVEQRRHGRQLPVSRAFTIFLHVTN